MISTLKVAVLGFALASGWVVYHSHDLRQQLEERVRWVVVLDGVKQGMEGAADGAQAQPGQQALSLRSQEELRNLRPSLTAALPAVDVGHQLDIVDGGLRGEVGLERLQSGATTPAQALGTLTRALRNENAQISASLGALWDGLNVLVLFALAFAWATLSYATHSRGVEAQLGRLQEELRAANEAGEQARRLALNAERRWELLGLVGEGLWEWHPAEGMRYSATWKAMIGLPLDAPLEHTGDWFERIHKEDRAAVEEAFGKHLFGEAPRLEVEYRIRHADGRWRWMRARAVCERNLAGEAVSMLGIQAETSDRRALRPIPDRSSLLRQVSNGLGLGLITLSPDGNITPLSTALDQLARPWGDVPGWWRAIQRNLSWPRQSTCPECRQTVPMGPTVADIYTPEGERRVFRITWTGHGHSLSSDAVPLVLTVEDVSDDTTHREGVQNLRRDLSRTREEMNIIIERSRDAIALVADGRVVYGNPALRELIGISEPDGLNGRRFDEFIAIPAGSRPGTLPELRRPDGRSLPMVVATPVPIEYRNQPVELFAMTPGWFARLDELDPDSSLDGMISLLSGISPPEAPVPGPRQTG